MVKTASSAQSRYRISSQTHRDYLDECIYDIDDVVLPANVFETNWIHKSAEEAEGVQDAGLERHATSTDLVWEEFGCVGIEWCPSNVISPIA